VERRWHPTRLGELMPVAALRVTTPSGVTRISRPPGGEWLEPYELGTVSLEFADLDPAPF
jgi:hypothetical protein